MVRRGQPAARMMSTLSKFASVLLGVASLNEQVSVVLKRFSARSSEIEIPPSIASTGPLPDLPQTFCFRDFRHLSQGIDGLLEEEGREKEALSALLLAIALLDGAKVVGFEVGREERALEGLLKRLEERGLRV